MTLPAVLASVTAEQDSYNSCFVTSWLIKISFWSIQISGRLHFEVCVGFKI